MTWYKFLTSGATGAFSRFRWPAPTDPEAPGAWVDVPGPLEPCCSGLHVCRASDLPYWMLEELYTVEVDGLVLEYADFGLTGRARLLRRVEPWDRDLASAFGRACTWRVRDLAAGALLRTGRGEAADRLVDCDTTEELLDVAQVMLDDGEAAGPLGGYLVDAARFATTSGTGPRWSAGGAIVGFVAATAARVAAPRGEAEAAVSEERARQAEWLTDQVLAAV